MSRRARGMRATGAVAWALVVGLATTAAAQEKPKRQRTVPSGSSFTRLAKTFFDAEEAERVALMAEWDAKYKPLPEGSRFEKLRQRALAEVAERGPRIERSGTHWFFPETQSGKYIVEAPSKKPDALFIGLHGGGVGSGDAEGMASSMGGETWLWVFPEVLEKTERGWVDSGTEEFVLQLTEAARRTFDIDPNRVYVTGHSMGGHGTWSFAAHHPDIFAGGAAYAGGPTPIYGDREFTTIIDLETGLLPNLYRQNFLCFQSADDPRVPPEPNDFAFEQLESWKERYPDGFNTKYVRVTGRGHAAPAEGYLPTQRWVASHAREPWPTSFLWQPTLEWNTRHYYLIWPKPILECLLHVERTAPQCIDVRILEPEGIDPGPFSLLLREPFVDLSAEVQVCVNGEERFRGVVPRLLSTLLSSAVDGDESYACEARIDLE